MSKSKQKADRAVPVHRQKRQSDAQKVAVTQTIAAGAAASPNWQQAPAVQQAVGQLTTKGNGISAQVGIVKNLRDQLLAAEGMLVTLRRDWELSYKSVTNTVEVFANGNSDVVRGFGFEVRGQSQSGLLPAPMGLTLMRGTTAGSVEARWARGDALNGFIVQHATDPANPATYSAIQPRTRTKITLGGLLPGAVVFVRVAAIDPRSPDDQSPWSEWESATAR